MAHVNQVSHNARWLAISQVIRLSIQLLSITIIARILKPEHYGIVALSASVLALANLFKDLGLGSNLIQSENLNDDDKSTAFTISFIMSVFLFLLIAILSSSISTFYEQPDLKWVLIIVAIGFPFSSLLVVPTSIMEREGRFKKIAMIEITANITGFAITLIMAISGWGVYSLVIPSLIVIPINLILFYRATQWSPTFKISRESLHTMFGFSANLTGFNLINFLSRNFDVFLVGKLLGATALGLYSTAIKLMLMPLQTVTYVSNRAMFPVLSQQRNDIETFRNTYLNAVSYVALITFPMMFGLWVCRESFVYTIYGEKWLGLIDLLYWLSLTGVIQSINSTTGTVYMAAGKTNLMFKLGLFSAILQVSAFYIGAQTNIEMLCRYYFLANLIAALSSFYFVTQEIKTTFQHLLKRLSPAIISSAGLIAVALLIRYLFLDDTRNYSVIFVKQVIAGVVAYLLILKFVFTASWIQLKKSIFKQKL